MNTKRLHGKKNPIDNDIIDPDGYRKNVGIVLCNGEGEVLWARRCRHDGWQFPQGGIEHDETAQQAAYRELYEEIGLQRHQVDLIGVTQSWFYYDLPTEFLRLDGKFFRGQKQLWFLFKMLTKDSDICLTNAENPEFDLWRWVDYWEPIKEIIDFKKDVYRNVLTELRPLMLNVIDKKNT